MVSYLWLKSHISISKYIYLFIYFPARKVVNARSSQPRFSCDIYMRIYGLIHPLSSCGSQNLPCLFWVVNPSPSEIRRFGKSMSERNRSRSIFFRILKLTFWPYFRRWAHDCSWLKKIKFGINWSFELVWVDIWQP